MSGLRIYIEGGGDGRRRKAALRTGFQAFLKSLRDAARVRRVRWDVILCGGRQAAFEDYCTALRAHPDSVCVLLVDAEGSVASPPWRHLEGRDGWRDPGAGDGRCHLMVQTVEAWLVADPGALEDYYGNRFHRGALAVRKNVEEIPKADVLRSLQQATRNTQKGEYRKIRHCADLLARLSAQKVRGRAHHCDRLFNEIENLIVGL